MDSECFAVMVYVPRTAPAYVIRMARAFDSTAESLGYTVESSSDDSDPRQYGADYYWLFNNQRVAAFVASALYRAGSEVSMQNRALFELQSLRWGVPGGAI